VNDDRPERRTNHALRHRIDQLIGRVRSAEEEIVERGLDAVQDEKAADGDGSDGARRTARDGDDDAQKP
jgi:hypothetical protein